MQTNFVLQAVQESLPPDEWPFVFEALRQDPIIWTELQDPELCSRILAFTRVHVQDWSPASLALSNLAQGTSLELLKAQPSLPLDPGLSLHAIRALEMVTRESDPHHNLNTGNTDLDNEISVESPVDLLTLEQACYLALALRERFRSLGDWNELIKELESRTPEKPETWRTPLAILLGMIPEPVDMLQALIHPSQPMSNWELGIHAMLSNPNYPSAHLAQLQAVMHASDFSPTKSLILLRYLTALSPTLAQNTAAWLMQQEIFTQAPESKGVLEACQEAIQLAEIQSAAGAEAQALITLERARDISKRLQADPFSGALFVFGNRARTAIKVLVYDGQGFWMCHKRLSSAKFMWWPDGEQPARTLQACELQVLLMAGDPSRAHAAPAWRALSMAA